MIEGEGMRPAADLARELEKVASTLDWADKHFVAEGQMNAAAHMNERVLFSPLAVSVAQAKADVDRLVLELKDVGEYEQELVKPGHRPGEYQTRTLGGEAGNRLPPPPPPDRG